MIHTIRLYIEKYRLLSEDRPVLVGLSGGADSVALLGVLVRLGYPCIALHCNFHLRGRSRIGMRHLPVSSRNLWKYPFIR